MYEDWPKVADTMNPLLAALRKASPEVMRAFGSMAVAATQSAALDVKTKELVALAISVAVRCDACITYHAKAAVKSGATDAEIAEAVGMAIYMGAGPSVMYAAQAIEAAGQWRELLMPATA